MTLELLEGALDALYQYLSAGMDSKVAALNARYNDTITLESIKKWYPGALPFNYPETPSIAISGVKLSPGSQQSPGLFESNNVFNIVVMVGDAEPEVRFRKLCRYALGIVELLLPDDVVEGYEVFFEGDFSLSDVLSTPDFLQAINIPVRLHAFES